MRKKSSTLTEKELPIMQILWRYGPMRVKEMLPHYLAPHPHINTVATVVRILEEKGYVGHETSTGNYRYYAITPLDDYRAKAFDVFVNGFFEGSYKSAVTNLVSEDKISVADLREIIAIVEDPNKLTED